MGQISFLKVHFLTAAAVSVALSSFARLAEAAVVTSGCASTSQCTVQELFDGGSITVGRLVFSDFAFIDGERNPGGPPQATQMIVIGLEDGGANPGQGLSYDFDSELSLASGGNQSMTFRFAFNPRICLANRLSRDTCSIWPPSSTRATRGPLKVS
jgi:hypothetical protein